MQLKTLLFTIIVFIVAFLLFCLLIPRSRKYFFYTVRFFLKDLWDIMVDNTPAKDNKVPFWKLVFVSILVAFLSILLIIPICIICPIICIIRSIKDPKSVDDFINIEKGIFPPRPETPPKTPEELEAERRAYQEQLLSIQFEVPQEELGYSPSEKEIIFYSPEPASVIEKEISENLSQIKAIFAKRGYRFFFLPEIYNQLEGKDGQVLLDYYNPNPERNKLYSTDVLTYPAIKAAICIPERVDAPCFIRCKRQNDNPAVFSFWKIQLSEKESLIEIVKDYFSKVGDGRLYHLASEKEIRKQLERLPADERYDTDILLIGKEIRERIEKLRAIGLTSLAIKKLIGDDSDKPGKLLIDKKNRLILTDYGNKEIKLSPLHKAVFFLFLRHPEGIYFKDLGNYKEELASIYGEITGREDKKAIEDSIAKLTDPFDNSINEKCARIKNAFVSEFREEVAQWYFIDGSKGEKKSIKLPRELVTWEIKD